MTVNPAQILRGVGFGDPHFAMTAPPSCRDPEGYFNEFQAFIDQTYKLAMDIRADFIFCPGDWFHSKGHATHADTTALIDLLRPMTKAFGPVLTIMGNHDLKAGDLSGRGQPFAVLEAAGVVQRVDLTPKRFVKAGARYVVTGRSYGRSITNAPDWLHKEPETAGALLLTHHDTAHDSPQAQAIRRAYCSAAKTTANGVLVVANGHLHGDQGVTTVGVASSVGMGSLSRTSTPERDRVPCLTVVTMGGGKHRVRFAPLACLPEDETFVEPAAADTASAELGEFITELCSEVDGSAPDLHSLLRAAGAGLPSRALAEAERILTEAA